MQLCDLIKPVSLEDFRDDFFGKRCFLVKRNQRMPDTFVSLRDIEARLNDGVATRHGITMIGPDGTKLEMAQFYARQTGPAWSPNFVRKTQLKGLITEGCSFVLHNMSSITPAVEALIREVEQLSSHVQADVHIYVSPCARASGYNVHRDQPQHKLYLQLEGSTNWTVYKGTDSRRAISVEEAHEKFTVDFRAKLGPGSVLYMPPGVFHHASNPDGPRVSLSIPFYDSPSSTPVDREPLLLGPLFATD